MGWFPAVRTKEEFRAMRRDPSHWLPGVRAICERHGLPSAELEPFPVGSNVVFGAGTRVVKVVAPFWPREFEAERLLLQAAEGRLGVATPAIEAHGEEEGWKYLVMSRLDGRPSEEVWDRVPEGDRGGIAYDLGAALGRLHALRVPDLERIEPPWPALFDTQRSHFAETQRVYGHPNAWIREATEHLDRLRDAVASRPAVPIHADVTWEHVFLHEDRGRWRLAGLIDFADAMEAPLEYELAKPWVHWLPGRPDLFARLLDGCGVPASDRTADLADRILATALVHRFIDLRGTVDRLVPGRPASGLDEMRGTLFDFPRARGTTGSADRP